MKLPSGSIIGMFGLPCSGKSTIIQTLKEASKELIAYISTGDIARNLSTRIETEHMEKGNLFPYEDIMRSEITKLISQRRSQGARIIFLDGCPRFGDQVKWMVEQQYVGVGSGVLVKIIGDNLQARAKERMRDGQDEIQKFMKKIVLQEKMIGEMEPIIFQYSIPYFTIINSNLALATRDLAKRIGLRK